MSVLDEREADELERCLRKLTDHVMAVQAEGGGVTAESRLMPWPNGGVWASVTLGPT